MSDLPGLTRALAGRYDIERQIGVGGMATVYLAQDVRHGRPVALKILRPELAAVIGGERFLAEIRTTAALQHPHILPLHDSGEVDGTVFYVMPYIEGESLRDRIRHEHQLPVEDAVRIAGQVASALDYAHRHGVVHRDIKPENILLQDGQALVADFGIALAVSRSDGGTRMTETGMSLGTPHYMAPEQAMGEREISPKADVYALGCVLYEMLTGEPPFTGATAQAVIARAMTETPRLLSIQRHTIPRHVEAAVFTALEKLPADRFATAEEFAEALTDPRYASAASPGASGAAAGAAGGWRSTEFRARLALPLALVALASLAVLTARAFRADPPELTFRLPLAFAPQQSPVADLPFRLSPDGKGIVYLGPAAGASWQLWYKGPDRWDAVPLERTADAGASFAFSPDGRAIAFVAGGGQLQRVPVDGGAMTVLSDSATGGLTWLDDNTIVFVADGGRSLRRVSADGGVVTTVVRGDYSGYSVAPEAIPGSRGVLFGHCSPGCAAFDVMAIEFGVSEPRSLDLSGVALGAVGLARYVEPGYLLFARPGGVVAAAPFDARSLTVTGPAVPVIDGVATGRAGLMWDVTPGGTLLTRSGEVGLGLAEFEAVWVDRSGRQTPIDTAWHYRMVSFGANAGWALSPDGTRLAIGLNTDAGDDIWVKRLPAGALSRITVDSAADFRPRWSRDGGHLFFISTRGDGRAAMYARRSDGTGQDSLVLKLPDPGSIFEAGFAPDGRSLVLRSGGTVNVVGGRDISVIRLGTDSLPRQLIATQFDEEAIALSPDGTLIAYETNETGRTEVYVRPYPNADGGKWQVSVNGGGAPLWSRNGRELFFVDGSRSMVAVPVAPGAVPTFGAHKVLFTMPPELYLLEREFYTPFDISADGQRFLMSRQRRAASRPPEPLVLTLNWRTELVRKMGGR